MVTSLEMALTEIRDDLTATADKIAQLTLAADKREYDIPAIYEAYRLLTLLITTDLNKFEVTGNNDDLYGAVAANVAFLKKRRSELPIQTKLIYGGVEILLGELLLKFRYNQR